MLDATETTIGSSKPPRRAQAERTASTRTALLDATIECLIELGYESTTTARVAERAGLSRGAHLYHFQTRAALVAAAVDHLARRRGSELIREVERLDSGADYVGQGLDLLWRDYSSPLFYAALDLATAARTDLELAGHLIPIERMLATKTLELCRTMFADGPEDESLDRWIELALNTIRGVALLPLLTPTAASSVKQWQHCRERLLELYEQAKSAA